MSLPAGVTVDRNGNLYVSDTYNHRVLLYTAPIATGDRIADRVFGQPDFNTGTENTGGVSARSMFWPVGLAFDAYGNLAVGDYGNNRVVLLEAPTPIVTSIAVKVARATRTPKLLVQGFGMVSGRAVVEVDGTPLTTKYKEIAADGSARRLIATDDDFGALVPRGVPVTVTIFDPVTGSRSAPLEFTR
jgi:hypothetical protein